MHRNTFKILDLKIEIKKSIFERNSFRLSNYRQYPMVKTLFLIGIGGAIGSILRYLTSILVERFYSSIFPLATLSVNVLGCLLIGIIMGLLEKKQLADSSIKWLFVTGFCGGYTTFSTFGFDNVSLLQNQHSGLAFLYIATSVIVGLFAGWLVLLLVK